MANWTVNGISFLPLTGANNTSGLVTGKYWMGHVSVGARIYERRRITLPGLDGISIKRYGGRGRPISGEVIYINTTFAGVFAALEGDRDTFENDEYDVGVPQGGTYANCELVSFDETQTYFGSDGKYILRGMLSLFSLD